MGDNHFGLNNLILFLLLIILLEDCICGDYYGKW